MNDSVSRRRLLSTAVTSLPLAIGGNALAGQLNVAGGFSNSAAADKQSPLVSRLFTSNRMELVRLLKEITEVEHSLMLQYLYTGFSIKPEYAALAGSGAPDSNSFIGVAIQEMQHLGAINRLLVELGGAPNLDVQDFPFEYDIYPFAFSLEPLSRKTVAKYVYCEGSEEVINGKSAEKQALAHELRSVLGNSLRINHVGSVYEFVVDLFETTVREEKLAIDREYWVGEMRRIMDEGEHQHFDFFSSVFMGTHSAFGDKPSWWLTDPGSGDYPAYACVQNPSAYPGQVNLIKDEKVRTLAWLGNLYYWAALGLLDFYYRNKIDSARQVAIMAMMSPLRSIGTELARQGYGLPFDRLSLSTSPGINAQSNLEFCAGLLREAGTLARRFENILPSDYPQGFEAILSAEVKGVSEQLSKQQQTAKASKLLASK